MASFYREMLKFIIALGLGLMIVYLKYTNFNSKEIGSTLSTNGVNRFSFIKNITKDFGTGEVITRNNSVWEINKDICVRRKSKFILAYLKSPPNTPIFVYPSADDIHVSDAILTRGEYEGQWVQKIHTFLKQNPKTVFIDIGANVGMYSITLAALGYRVISIDVLDDNIMHLCASMKMAKLTDKMTIIFNAVSDMHENITLGRHIKDVGGTFVKHVANDGDETVQSICLDDLLEIYQIQSAIIKMDVEKSEDKVLKGAYNFFRKVKIDAVLLEFIKHRTETSGQFIVDFLSSFGLQPEVEKHVRNDYRKWTINNILFTRQK